MTTNQPILIVDDDREVRESLCALLEAAGFAVRSYVSANALLSDELPENACLITDIRMPGMDGMELQAEIVRRGLNLQVIIITGHGDIPLAVRALRAGATDFLEKPFSAQTMLTSVKRAFAVVGQVHNKEVELKAAQQRLAMLTPRERDVFDQIVAGKPNKIAAHELKISSRTVEVHRSHIMGKMNARNLSDLVRISMAASASSHGST
ncbi:MAG TPA: response regulator [Rhizomicrobium sp.]|jgi:two-component system response regulator FixJ|nr:response regulator [Rhizomicrobium sp.]